MSINVEIKPEDVERAVIDAITESAIGDSLKEIVEKSLGDMTDQFDSPLKRAINSEVSRLIMQTLRDEYAEKIRDAVRAKITDQVVDQVVGVAWDMFLAQICEKASR